MSGHDDDDVSPGGSKMLRHGAAPTGWIPPAPSTGGAEIEQHFEKHFGTATTVFHEIVSSVIHVDIHVIPPGDGRPCWTLFTSGMSDLPMTVEPGFEERRFAELLLKLPADWPIDKLQVTPPRPELEQWYWPIGWLKFLARFPHEHRTWLGQGHTLPNGDPPQPFAPSTKLCAWLLLPPTRVAAAARTLTLADGRVVHLYVVHALHPEELTLKLERGTNELLRAFDAADVSETLTIERAPVLPRRKLFGLF